MRTVMTTAILAAWLMSAPAGASPLTEVMDDLFGTEAQGCSPQVKLKLGEALTRGIENEVRRREQLIKNPIALQGLTCLDNLMNVNLDFAITVPDVGGLFDQAVSDAGNRLCSMAQDKLAEITGPLQEALDFDPFERLNIPGMEGGGAPTTIDFGTLSAGGGAGTAPLVTYERPSDASGSFSDEMLDSLFGD